VEVCRPVLRGLMLDYLVIGYTVVNNTLARKTPFGSRLTCHHNMHALIPIVTYRNARNEAVWPQLTCLPHKVVDIGLQRQRLRQKPMVGREIICKLQFTVHRRFSTLIKGLTKRNDQYRADDEHHPGYRKHELVRK